jgi:hypothetical protein
MPNFAWTMADFALQFPGHIMPLSMLALLCLSNMATDLAILSDGGRTGTTPRRLYKLRIRADYRVDLAVTQALAQDDYEEAKMLVHAVGQEVG